MKLRTKFGVVLLVVALLLSAAVYGGLEVYGNQVRERSQENVNETTELAAQQIESSLSERMDYIGLVASRPEAARFDRSEQYLDGILDSTRFFAAQVVAENGTVLTFRGAIDQSVRQNTVGTDVSNESYFAGAIEQGVHVTEPQYVEGVDRYIVVISAPIFENRNVTGVLAASIYVTEETFFNSIVPIDTGRQSVTIRDPDENAVLYRSEDTFDRGIEASTRIEPVGWTLTVTRDQSALNARLEELALAQGAGLVVVLLSVVLIGVWEYRENLQQTHRLLDGFASLQAGEYDVSLDLSTSEEWLQISRGFNDLSEALARREAELRQREQRLQVLNRVLRHNLRNDMSVVVNSAELIGRFAENEQATETAENVAAIGRRLVRTGEKARRLESLLSDPAPRTFDMVPVVESVLAELRETHPDARIESTIPEHAAVTAVEGVDFLVENLVENAVVHDDSDEPRVRVTLERVETPRQAVRLTVADDGPGIPEHERDVLVEGTEMPLQHGSGVGLWAVQWVIEASDGELTFDVTDEGTTVQVLLPAAAAEAASASAPPDEDRADEEE